LVTHSNCQKHLANAKIAAESGTASNPISVQIVLNEDDDQDDSEDGVGGESGEVLAKAAPIRRKFPFSSTPSSTPRRNNYRKKYRPEWEEDPTFAGNIKERCYLVMVE